MRGLARRLLITVAAAALLSGSSTALVAAPAAAAAPGPVQLVEAEGWGIGEVRVAWWEPDSAGSDPIDHYLVTAHPSGETQVVGPEDCLEGMVPYPNSGLETIFTGLDPDQRTSFTIAAMSVSGGGYGRSVATDAVYPRPRVGNLTLNPSFEGGLRHWSSYQGALSRVVQAGAPDGGAVVKVTRSKGTSFTLGDAASAGALPTIASTQQGRRHVAVAQVKAASASSVGKPVTLVLRERTQAGAILGTTRSATTKLTTQWQGVTVSANATRTGSTLGVAVEQGGAGAGNAFFADGVHLWSGAGVVLGTSGVSPTSATTLGTDMKRGTPAMSEWFSEPGMPIDCSYDLGGEMEITSIRAYLDGKAAGAKGSQPVRGVLYGPDGKLLATTQAVTIAAGRAGSWVDLPLLKPYRTWATEAHAWTLGVQAGGTTKVVRTFSDPTGGDSWLGGPGTSRYNADAFGDGPSASFGPAQTATAGTLVYAYGGS